jgi:tetratricopeptide (TPR) repeat protein
MVTILGKTMNNQKRYIISLMFCLLGIFLLSVMSVWAAPSITPFYALTTTPSPVPNTAEDWNRIGNEWLDKQQYEWALDAFERGLELDPDADYLLFNVGLSHFNLGNFDEAREYYDRALDENPDYARAYNSIGNIYYEEGDYDEALEMYEAAIDIEDDNAIYITNRGLAFYKLGETDLAIENYELAIELDESGDSLL